MRLVRDTSQMAVDLISLLALCALCAPVLSSAMPYRSQQYNPLEQSWSNRNLCSVPAELDLRLKTLDLSSNSIEQLNVLNLESLEKLDISYNHLNFIEKEAFKYLIHLDYMNLAMNLLDSNDISNGIRSKGNRAEISNISLPSLLHLNLHSNEIEYLPTVLFDSLPKLETLILRQNDVKLCDGKANSSNST
ncbi:hypothetical protein AOLI_G00066600 [Acnodon oligacanthus]